MAKLSYKLVEGWRNSPEPEHLDCVGAGVDSKDRVYSLPAAMPA